MRTYFEGTNDEMRAILKEAAFEAAEQERLGDYDGAIRIMNRALERTRVKPRPPKAERPRCGAMTRKGTPCKAPAVWIAGEPEPRNGRCRLHGGLSTGPRSEEGKAAIAESNRRRAQAVNRTEPW